MNPKLAAILLLGATLAAAQSDSALLFSECSDSSDVKRIVQSSDIVVVRHSLAGGPETCYAVSVSGGNGKVVEGVLLGPSHPSVIAFENKEENYIAQVLPSPAEPKQQNRPPQNHPKPAARPQPHPYKFWNPFRALTGAK